MRPATPTLLRTYPPTPRRPLAPPQPHRGNHRIPAPRHGLDGRQPACVRAESEARPSPTASRLAPGSAMGSLGGGKEGQQQRGGRRPRFLCLHGFRTSAEIMRKQVVGKWPADVTARLDLVFADAPFPAEGKSEVEGIFDPPYYEWFQFSKGFIQYWNFDECLAYIEDLIIKEGPIDGLMGFSQGAVLSAALPGFQEQGLALTRVPKIKYLVIIGGAKFRSETLAEKAYANMITCPSLHFIGDNDFLKVHGEKLIESFVDPLIIRHPKGHTVPRLDDKSLEVMLAFLEKIEKEMTSEHSATDVDEKGSVLVIGK